MVDVALLRRALALHGTAPRRGTVPLAMDRSLRTTDQDGRLRVASTPITAARVNGYAGSEIPDAARLGLQSDRIYQLLRDPAELAKAAPTFCNLPLLDEHCLVTANDHRPDLVVGSTGTDAVFDAPYLRVSLAVWAGDAIANIQSGAQRELSAAYRYVPVMQAGTYGGVPYDGRMTQIVGQHVALVDQGRVGSDVLVADAMPSFQRRKKMAADNNTDAELVSNLTNYLETCLTPEQMDNVKSILAGQDVLAPETTPAMDRVRQAREADKRLGGMFPNMNRLAR